MHAKERGKGDGGWGGCRERLRRKGTEREEKAEMRVGKESEEMACRG